MWAHTPTAHACGWVDHNGTACHEDGVTNWFTYLAQSHSTNVHNKATVSYCHICSEWWGSFPLPFIMQLSAHLKSDTGSMMWMATTLTGRPTAMNITETSSCHFHGMGRMVATSNLWAFMLENDIVMSSSLFMLITYYSVLTDTNERD